MALSREEKQIVEFGKANGKTQQEVLRAISQYRRHQQGISESKKGLIKEPVTDIVETGRGIRGVFDRASRKLQEAGAAFRRGEQGLFSTAFQGAGISAGALSDTAGEVAIGAAKLAAPQAVEEKVGGFVQEKVGDVVESDLVQSMLTNYESFKRMNPTAARNFEAALGFAKVGADVAGGVLAKPAASGVRQVTGGTLRRLKPSAGKTVNKTKSATSDVGVFGFSQVSGLSPDTVRLISNPKLNKGFNEALSKGQTRFDVAQDFANKLNKRLDDLSETGNVYSTIRTRKTPVKVSPTLMDDVLRRQGFDILDGEIKTTKASPTRNPSDVVALQRVYDDWSGIETLTPDEFLNFRSDLAELAKFDKISGKTKASETLAKEIRSELNTQGKKQIEGLEALDVKFASEKDVLDRIRKEVFDRDGALTDAGISKIANASGKTKSQFLQRVRQIDPDIEAKVRIIKAIEDVEYAKGQKVGSYVRGAVGGGLFVTGQPALAVLSIIATNPNAMVKYLNWASKVRGWKSARTNGMINKVKNGTPFTSSEKKLLGDSLNGLDEAQVRDFVDFLGGAGAVSGTRQEATN